MRILNVVSLGYAAGGAETHIREMSEVLRDRGHVVATLASDIGPKKELFADFTFQQVPVRGLRKIVSTVYNRAARHSLREVIRTFQPDVVVLHTLQQVTPAPLFELAHIPTILLIHGPEIYTRQLLLWSLRSRDFRTYPPRRFQDLTPLEVLHYLFYRAICDPLYRIAFRNVNEILVFSAYMRDLLRREGLPAAYIPLGVALFKQEPLPTGSPSLLYVGRIEREKGVFILLEAFAGALSSSPAARLVFAGNGKDRELLQSEAKSMGIDASLDFLGHVDRKDLQAVYARSSFVVVPSIYVEAFGKVGPEALSVGRPVIASDSGGIREWLQCGVNGLLVRPANTKDLEASISSLLENTDELKRLAAQAASSVTHLSIENHTDQFEELLSRVANDQPPDTMEGEVTWWTRRL